MVVPDEIVVHLGLPDEEAENITIPFIDYIKNVASSELYPSWPENALRANIHAIVSVALNRVFTGWYRLKGYNFDITSSTQLDQSFAYNRGTFDNINKIVDETFNQYILKEGAGHPLYALFCDGRVKKCNGLYQWASVDLANQGYLPIDILKYYYGENITIEQANVGESAYEFHGDPLKLGDSGLDIIRKQYQLDRISKNFPAIPKIVPLDGYYGESTEAAVKEFQRIFNLPVTGIIDQGTWYKIFYIYTAVAKLSEKTTEGVPLDIIRKELADTLLYGDTRVRVPVLQYFLTLLSLYYKSIPEVPITNMFDGATRTSVIEFQKQMGLPTTGIVDPTTWEKIYSSALGILMKSAPQEVYLPYIRFGGVDLKLGAENPAILILQSMLQYISLTIPSIPYVQNTGIFDETTENAVRAFQKQMNLEQTGIVDETTWNVIVDIYRQQRYGTLKKFPKTS